MKSTIVRIMLTTVFCICFCMSCESNLESDYNPPDDHTLNKDGIMHKSGLNDPDENCASCHGEDLRGGDVGISCHECHDKKW